MTRRNKLRLPYRWYLWRLAPLAAYLALSFAIIMFAWHTERFDQQAARNDRESARQREILCERQKENREGLRQVYIDVTALARSLIVQDRPPTDPRQQAQIARLDQFEKERLATLPPIDPDCPPSTTKKDQDEN